MRKLFSVTVLTLVMILASSAAAQKSELSVVVGRTFISDKGVTGIVSADNILHSGKGLTLEADYGRRLINLGIAGLTFEVPFAVNFNEKPHFDVNLVPKDYKAFFVTPSLRANIFPEAGLSPWVSVGGGFGHFMESSTLEFGGPNSGKTGTTSGVLQIGGGIDVKCGESSPCAAKCGIFSQALPSSTWTPEKPGSTIFSWAAESSGISSFLRRAGPWPAISAIPRNTGFSPFGGPPKSPRTTPAAAAHPRPSHRSGRFHNAG